MVAVTIETPVRATESPARVRLAILNLFPDAAVEESSEGLRAQSSSVERLGELLRNQRIRDAAREVMLGALRGDHMVLHLGKQAAYAGRVSFSAESPLGDILVTLEDPDLEALVDRIAPRSLPGPS